MLNYINDCTAFNDVPKFQIFCSVIW